MLSIVESRKVSCPLLQKPIAEGYCYDISAFLGRLVTADVLLEEDKDTVRRGISDVICDACEFNVF